MGILLPQEAQAQRGLGTAVGREEAPADLTFTGMTFCSTFLGADLCLAASFFVLLVLLYV